MPPTSLAQLRECIEVIRALANGREVEYNGHDLRFPWVTDGRLDVWVAAYGPKALDARGRGRRRLHPAAGRPGHRGLDDRCRTVGGGTRPAAIRRGQVLRRRAGVRRRRPRPPARSDAAGSAAWSATTSPTSSPATATGRAVPAVLTDYIAGRHGLRLREHGRAGNTHTDFVPDEVVDRFCVLGPVDAHLARLRELAGARRRPVRDLPAARRQGARRSTRTASTSSRPCANRSSPSASWPPSDDPDERHGFLPAVREEGHRPRRLGLDR